MIESKRDRQKWKKKGFVDRIPYLYGCGYVLFIIYYFTATVIYRMQCRAFMLFVQTYTNIFNQKSSLHTVHIIFVQYIFFAQHGIHIHVYWLRKTKAINSNKSFRSKCPKYCWDNQIMVGSVLSQQRKTAFFITKNLNVSYTMDWFYFILFDAGSPYVRAISPIKAVAGESFTIHCPYSGYPIESISWEKSGLELISSKLINICALCVLREVHKCIDCSSKIFHNNRHKIRIFIDSERRCSENTSSRFESRLWHLHMHCEKSCQRRSSTRYWAHR